MMKKNYFGMIMTAIVMMFAGWSLTSCSEKDVAIVDGEVWVKPDYQLTDDGAIVKGSSPADISRMMSRIKTEISDAAKAGKAFKISVDAAINSTSSDNEISIPTPPDADIELSFTNPIQTEVPLILKSKGVGDDAVAQASTNKLEIDLPSGSSDIDLELIFPTSSVTLKGNATIDELISTTGWETLNIESGVTVNELMNKGGYVVLKDGTKINSIIVEDQDLYVYEKGIRIPNAYNDSIRKTTDYTENDYVYVQSARINKNEKNIPSSIYLIPSKKLSQKIIPEIILSDGVYSWVTKWGTGDPEEKFPIVNITGEGNATMMPRGADWGSGPIQIWSGNRLELDCVNNLINVTVDYSKYLKMNDKGGYEINELGNDYWINEYYWPTFSEISLPINSENCTFKAMKFHCSGDMFNEDIVLSTHKGSTFDNLGSEYLPLLITHYPGQSEKRNSFIVAFDACGFKQANFGTEYTTGVEYDGFKGYMVFDNSKVGGKAITKDTDMIGYDWDPEGCATTYTIDGADYEVVFDTKTEKYILKAIEAE